jgi:tetratricopeptide (TPR) repeat protein
MATTHAEPGHGFAAAAQILEIPESRLRYWSQIGFVGPSLRQGGKARYSFRDLVNVKAAKELLDRGFSTSEIRKALETIRSSLPAVHSAIGRLRVAFDGTSLVVTDEGAAFEPSGQRVFDFALGDLAARAEAQGPATPLAPAAPLRRTAYEWLAEGLRIEADALPGGEAAAQAQAEQCYRRALELDPGLAAAHTNLAVLLHRRGHRGAARSALEAALGLDPEQPEARYDLAYLLLEDNENELAAAELRRVLQARPEFADAHYNLATALERLGGRRQAREHLLRFLELAAAHDPDDEGPFVALARSRAAAL